MKECTTKDCGKKVVANGLCKSHYYHMRRFSKDILRYGKCGVLKCEYAVYSKGFCGKHSRRNYRGNDPNLPSIFDRREAIVEGNIAKIPLGVNAKDGYAIVDKNFAWLDKYNWHSDTDGYAVSTGKKLHHMIIGKPQSGLVVDHINGDKLDNRKENLRLVTYSQNLENKGANSLNKSGAKGVYRNKNKKRWCAGITHKGKFLYIGTYDTIEQASNAYDATALSLRGDLAWLNSRE